MGLHQPANQYADEPAAHTGQNPSKNTAAAPKLVYAPNPEFPGRQETGGVVVVSCVVDVKGQPKQVVVFRSLSRLFDKNAVRAVEQYRFEPALFEGKAVPVKVNIEVNFKRY